MRFRDIKRRVAALEKREPDPTRPWPPKEGSYGWHIYEKLGRPVKPMTYFEMYFAEGEMHWRERRAASELAGA